MNVFLIGYRCSGKTTVGKRLARDMGRPFVDTDDLLVEQAGRSVKSIVDDEGWEGFRRLERDVVQKVCALENTVVATGGGAVLDADNVAAMHKSGRIVWLKVAPQTVKQRMSGDSHTDGQRPSLTAASPYDEIVDVLTVRTPLYAQAADASIDTDNKTIDEIAGEIIARIS